MKILVINPDLKPCHKDRINTVAGKHGASVSYTGSEAEIPDDFSDADIIYGFGINTARTSRTLKWLCVPSAGVDYLMKPDSFANQDCILSNSSGAYGVTIAEHIIASALTMMRCLDRYYKKSFRGEWGTEHYAQRSLKDSRITVLGTGDIGCSFAKRARGFEPASLTGVNRSGTAAEGVFDAVYTVDDLDDILPATDLLVMSLPATPGTDGILSRRRIMLLPEGAYIVNVGRGSAIDEDALADALDSGHLGGAALDVFRTEPLPAGDRLWNTGNLLITPHIAGNLTLDHTLEKNVEMFCEDLNNYLEGRPLKYEVDRKKGY